MPNFWRKFDRRRVLDPSLSLQIILSLAHSPRCALISPSFASPLQQSTKASTARRLLHFHPRAGAVDLSECQRRRRRRPCCWKRRNLGRLTDAQSQFPLGGGMAAGSTGGKGKVPKGKVCRPWNSIKESPSLSLSELGQFLGQFQLDSAEVTRGAMASDSMINRVNRGGECRKGKCAV